MKESWLWWQGVLGHVSLPHLLFLTHNCPPQLGDPDKPVTLYNLSLHSCKWGYNANPINVLRGSHKKIHKMLD